jgi:hypothetical protein
VLSIHQVALDGLVVVVLVIVPKIRGLTPGRRRWILRAIKIRSMTSFGWEVKSSSPCRKILRHAKNRAEYEGDISSAIFTAISRQVSLDSLLDISSGICYRALVDESGMIRIQIGTHN